MLAHVYSPITVCKIFIEASGDSVVEWLGAVTGKLIIVGSSSEIWVAF